MLVAPRLLLLPRQFHMTVVENRAIEDVKRAAWLFPLYLVLINLFVIPIALAGLASFREGTIDRDMTVLALPLARRRRRRRAGCLPRRAFGRDRHGDRRIPSPSRS